MTTATTNPTKEQFQAKLAELNEQRFQLIGETSKNATEDFFIQEELESVERRIRNYTARMVQLYGE